MSVDATTYLVSGHRGALSNWFRQYTLVIDPIKGSYTQKNTWFGVFRFTAAHPLPPIKYVLIFRQLFAKCEPCEMGEFEDDGLTWYQVSLVYGRYRRIIVHETRSRKAAFEKATTLGTLLGKKVLDAATNRRSSQWLQPSTSLFIS